MPNSSVVGGRLIGRTRWQFCPGRTGIERVATKRARDGAPERQFGFPNQAGTEMKNHFKGPSVEVSAGAAGTQLWAEQGSFCPPEQVFFWSGFFQVEIIPSTWPDS